MNTQWDETRLLALISDQIEEADQLEYKAANALQKTGHYPDEVGKDVSSFANAGGGTIIYGIKEFADPLRKHLPEKIDPIDRVNITREWLEHITSRIEPRIPELKIVPVTLSSDDQHVAYVVEIPKGMTAHQAPVGKYYRRYNFEVQWMKDHEIRDVMRRKHHPAVETEIRIWMNRPRAEAGLFWKVTNIGNVIAQHVMTSIVCPQVIRGFFLAGHADEKWNSVIDDDGVVSYRLIGSNKLGLPLFPKSELSRVFKFRLSGIPQWTTPVKHLEMIRFQTFADEMPFISGELNANEITEIKP